MARALLPSAELPDTRRAAVADRSYVYDTPPTEAPPPVRGGGRPSRDLPTILAYPSGVANASGVDLTPWGDDVAAIARIAPSAPDAMSPALFAPAPTGSRCVPEPWDDPYVLGDSHA